eukprot:TRINITY_DN114054_c0_g1_i1.p1 TRINITY_DN114054_c0_g1~~TRINITY_DN114054_c0_g1_i1.p1  ORF type:complete len:791 (+),score=203.75 TRINITY_DN114054_c0_g1_i1:89-2374(+)
MSFSYFMTQALEVLASARVELFLFTMAFAAYYILAKVGSNTSLKGKQKISSKKLRSSSRAEGPSPNDVTADTKKQACGAAIATHSAPVAGSADVLQEKLRRTLQVAGPDCEKKIADLMAESTSDSLALVPFVKSLVSRSGPEVVMPLLRVVSRQQPAGGLIGSSDHAAQSLWNVALDASATCHGISSAEVVMKTMRIEGRTDVVSWNTLIKAHLNRRAVDRAMTIMKEDMRSAGFEPNVVTYNELLHALTRSERSSLQEQVWEVAKCMKRDGVRPNKITCSILLSGLKARSPPEDVVKTLEVIDGVQEAIDEVLQSSILEACMRVKRPELLRRQLDTITPDDVSNVRTFGTLIKAYGHVKDVPGVWRCWKVMRSRHVKLTSVTIGCMVEAVVSNGDVDGGYELISGLLEDDMCKDQINAVIYGSVLKGYGRAQRVGRVLEVFDEMLASGIEAAVPNYNSVIDACVRSGNIQKVPPLIAQMKAGGLEPNLITHTTIIKGFSQQGDVAAAMEALQELRTNPALQVDEIVYSTVFGGCLLAPPSAGPLKVAETLLEDMQSAGLTPTNYVLFCMAKLLGSAGRLDEAFFLVEATARRYHFRLSGQAYSGLVQACLNKPDLKRAVATFERTLQSRQQLEGQTCQGLLRALVDGGEFDEATKIIRQLVAMATASTQAGYSFERQRSTLGLDAGFLSSFSAALEGAAGRRVASESATAAARELAREVSMLLQARPGAQRATRDIQRRRIGDGPSESTLSFRSREVRAS